MVGRTEEEGSRREEEDGVEEKTGYWLLNLLPHLSGYAFCWLLFLRMRTNDVPWRTVMAPTIMTDAIILFRRVCEVRGKHRYEAIGASFDVTGVLVSKLFVTYYLEGYIEAWTVGELLGAFWIGTLGGALFRGIANARQPRKKKRRLGQRSSGRSSSMHSVIEDNSSTSETVESQNNRDAERGGEDEESPQLKKYKGVRCIIPMILHCIVRGLVPGLITAKIDAIGVGSASWAVVFAPLWCLLALVACMALMLCNCAPLLSAGMSPRAKRVALRLVSFCAAQLFVIALFGFSFLYHLTKRLDCTKDTHCGVTELDIFGPILLMYTLLFLLHPLVLRDSKEFHRLLSQAELGARNDEANDDNDDSSGNARRHLAEALAALNHSLVGSEDSDVLLETMASGPTRLVEYSSTLYARASSIIDDSLLHLPEGSFPDHDGYTNDNNDDNLLESLSITNRVTSTSEDSAATDSPSLCYVCYTAPHDAVLMECGHGGCCFSCAQKLALRHPRACPICRRPISTVLKLPSVRDSKKRTTDSSKRVYVLADQGLVVVPASTASSAAAAPPPPLPPATTTSSSATVASHITRSSPLPSLPLELEMIDIEQPIPPSPLHPPEEDAPR